MSIYGKPQEIKEHDVYVGITAGRRIRVQITENGFVVISPELALQLSRDLMRMAFILEPPEPKPDAPPDIPER
jgi:hypothetical protein